jgi:MraZ protein
MEGTMAGRLDGTFLGEYEHALDDKGRLIVPSKLRPGLGDTFVVTRGLEACLFVYPLEVWREITSQLGTLPFTAEDTRMFTRMFYSGAVEVTTDRQGRFIIPPGLRRYAGLEKETVFIGVSNRVEIWSSERWGAFCERAETEYQTAAEELFRKSRD